MRALIVDDSRAMRMIIRRELRDNDYIDDIVEAEDGQAAIELMAETPVGIVFSDWNMPTMSGIDLLHAVRGAGWTGKFGFITSESSEAIKSQALGAGADFLVTKPFTAASLERAMTVALGGEPTSAIIDERTGDRGLTVVSVLEGLLRRPVQSVRSDPPRREAARVVARYVDGSGEEAAVCIAEISFAAAAGAALTLWPPADAAECAKAGYLPEAIAKNFSEVANVLAPIVHSEGRPCKLSQVNELLAHERLSDDEALVACHRRDLEVTVDQYGSGRISFITLG
ncbi:MAG: response regulator [Acidimicrobiales bacterium]